MKTFKQLSDGFSRLTRRLGVWENAGKNCTILKTDTFLVSYPKSGNTWLRFLLAQVMAKQQLDFYTIEKIIPDIYENSDHRLLKIKNPRVLKSHETYCSDYPRVIYIVRDPRDVAISYYYWQKKVGMLAKYGADFSLRDYLKHGFLESEKMGIISWAKHVDSWVSHVDTLGEHLLIIRYEDIEKEPSNVLRQVIDFVDLKVDNVTINNAVNWSQADEMRQAETVTAASIMPDIVLKWLNKERIPFVRKGKSGQWREVFDDELENAYWTEFGKWMEKFNYEKK